VAAQLVASRVVLSSTELVQLVIESKAVAFCSACIVLQLSKVVDVSDVGPALSLSKHGCMAPFSCV
jgi:hypothetical protein